MSLARNLKMYIKEKSTITALVFMVVFAIATCLTFIDSLSYKKGISENFKNYKIDYMTTNNYNVVFAVSDNYLFYSQDKEEASTLNDFAGIHDLSNEYGSATSNEYNFIRINYRFSDEIIDVKSIRDNSLGAKGETWVLTKDHYLYSISNRSKTVELVHRDIKAFALYKDYSKDEIYYLLHDINNNLFKAYIKDNVLYKEFLIKQEMNDFYYLGNNENVDKIIYNYNDSLFELSCNNTEFENKNFINEQKISYSIKTVSLADKVTINTLPLNSNKMVSLDEKVYSLYDGKVNQIILNNKTEIISLTSNEYINDIYTSGVDSLIGVCKDKLLYIGDLRVHESKDYINFETLDVDGLIYSGNNATFLLNKKGYLYIYNVDNNEYQIMYQRTLLKLAIRYLSIFVVVMTLFYLIVAFLEANKRYNRYFLVNKNK